MLRFIGFQGSPILTVTALDGDRGIPNNVTYSFESGNHQWFELDENSGVISVGPGGLDREDPAILDLFGVLEFVVRVSAYAKPCASHK